MRVLEVVGGRPRERPTLKRGTERKGRQVVDCGRDLWGQTRYLRTSYILLQNQHLVITCERDYNGMSRRMEAAVMKNGDMARWLDELLIGKGDNGFGSRQS